MRAVRTVRRFCTLGPQEQAIINFDRIAAPLRNKARHVASALSEARDATTTAAAEGSDDEERREALLKVKHALRSYSQLAALGDPPVQLSENGKPMEDFEDGQNDVTRLFERDIETMKKEIFDSNRQRVWIGWWGWF